MQDISLVETERNRWEAYLPTEHVQNHASNLLPCTNGDLLCAWFSGTQEGMSDISIYLSRLPHNSSTWSKPINLSGDPERSEQNPVLFEAPDGTLRLFWTAQISGKQNTSIVRQRISKDAGHSWGPVQVLFDQPGTFIRQPLLVLDNGDWLFPIYYCRSGAGKKWTGNQDISAVKISSDEGRSWKEFPVPESIGLVHMNIEQLEDGSLIAFFRSRWADNIYTSYSEDAGRSWAPPVPTILPNNNSSIQATRLQSGRLAITFNRVSAKDSPLRRDSLYDEIDTDETEPDSNESAPTPSQAKTREAVWGVPRAPLTVALSEDGGGTWPYMLDLETGDGYCLTNDSREGKNREYSYPSIKQSKDGFIHISYTYFRQRIKYLRLTEQYLLEKGIQNE